MKKGDLENHRLLHHGRSRIIRCSKSDAAVSPCIVCDQTKAPGSDLAYALARNVARLASLALVWSRVPGGARIPPVACCYAMGLVYTLQRQRKAEEQMLLTVGTLNRAV